MSDGKDDAREARAAGTQTGVSDRPVEKVKGTGKVGEKRRQPKRRPTEVSLPPPGRMALSLDECAALAGVCVNTIRRAVKAGELTVHRLGARVLVRRAEYEAFLGGLPEGFQTRKAG